MTPQDFLMMPIPSRSYTAVCALLSGAVIIANPNFGQGAPQGNAGNSGPVPQDTGDQSGQSDNSAVGEQSSTSTTATTDASPSDAVSGEVDAHGHPWSADLHASTKGKTKDGLWRMKVGVSRPDPLPGFPKAEASADTGTSSATDTTSATSQGATEQGAAPTATAEAEDDEFAAFRAAAASSEATDAAAAASVPARTWADADLGALCNQAAVKLGDPTPVKEIISRYVPDGEVKHSRNIPTDKREDFAKEVEAKAGIEFAG